MTLTLEQPETRAETCDIQIAGTKAVVSSDLLHAKIVTGDCIEVMRAMPDESVDMIFADPPFNVGKKYGVAKDRRTDYPAWCHEWIAEGFRLLKPTGSFYLMTIARHLPMLFPAMERHGKYINLIQWNHSSGANNGNSFWNGYQPIMLYGKTDAYKFNRKSQIRKTHWKRWGGYTTQQQGHMLDVWNDIPFVYSGSISHPEAVMSGKGKSKAHPCQMPTGLATRAMMFSTDEGDTVMDPFNGSGTTAVSAKQLNRRYIGIEINPEYVQLTHNRLKQDALALGV